MGRGRGGRGEGEGRSRGMGRGRGGRGEGEGDGKGGRGGAGGWGGRGEEQGDGKGEGRDEEGMSHTSHYVHLSLLTSHPHCSQPHPAHHTLTLHTTPHPHPPFTVVTHVHFLCSKFTCCAQPHHQGVGHCPTSQTPGGGGRDTQPILETIPHLPSDTTHNNQRCLAVPSNHTTLHHSAT